MYPYKAVPHRYLLVCSKVPYLVYGRYVPYLSTDTAGDTYLLVPVPNAVQYRTTYGTYRYLHNVCGVEKLECSRTGTGTGTVP